jgi:hypothetical protein
MLTPRERNKQIKALLEKEGWQVRFFFSDKRAYGRRVKIMRNGWPVPNEMKERILNAMTYFLAINHLDKTHSVEWENHDSFRGPYDCLILRIKE